ncbi:hypothetical protein DPMN_072728 [Dreissena polymorpha]|uniref:Uncharacterized protein n=1 Tax=Dreissena polymorpha TaxID=45954 RepID=A0A9D4BXU8_DREPO|nr:hypothetical protein DPMN_072728 [Dreissena polymorpha]
MRLTTFLSHGSETGKHACTTISALSQGSEESPLIQTILYSICAAAVVLLILLVIWCLKDRIERSIGRLRQWFCELTLQLPLQEMNQDPKWNQMELEVQNLLHNFSQPKDNGKRLNVVRLTEASAPPLDIADESNSQTNSF